MTESETTSFVRMLAGMYTVTPTKEAVQYWHKTLRDIPREIVEAGFDAFQATATNNNCPIPGQIKRESLAQVAPFLKLSFSEAKRLNHPLYRVAVKREGSVKKYNPRSGYAPTPEEMVWIEKEQEKVFTGLRNKYLERPLKELPACQTHFDAKLAEAITHPRIDFHEAPSSLGKTDVAGVIEDLRQERFDEKVNAGFIAKTRDHTEPHPLKPEPAPVTTKEFQGCDDQRAVRPDDYSEPKKEINKFLKSEAIG